MEKRKGSYKHLVTELESFDPQKNAKNLEARIRKMMLKNEPFRILNYNKEKEIKQLKKEFSELSELIKDYKGSNKSKLEVEYKEIKKRYYAFLRGYIGAQGKNTFSLYLSKHVYRSGRSCGFVGGGMRRRRPCGFAGGSY